MGAGALPWRACARGPGPCGRDFADVMRKKRVATPCSGEAWRVLAQPDHVLDELTPEEKQAAVGVFEMAVAGEADDAGGKVELDLVAHFAFEGIFGVFGIGHAQQIRGDLVALEKLVMVEKDAFETILLAGDIIPADERRALEGEGEREIGGAPSAARAILRGAVSYTHLTLPTKRIV